MEITDAAQVTSNLMTALGVVVGGIWVFFKFIKGRTFSYRAKLDTTSRIIDGPRLFLLTRVTLTNEGATKIPLDKEVQVVRIFGMSHARPGGPPSWGNIMTVRVLQKHDWIEPGETVSDDVAVALPRESALGLDWLALRINAVVAASASPNRRRVSLSWQSFEVMIVGEEEGG